MLPRIPCAKLFVLALTLVAVGACSPSHPAVSRSATLTDLDQLAGHMRPVGNTRPCPRPLPGGLTKDPAHAPCPADTQRQAGNASVRLGLGDYADAGSSAVAAASGLSELNPVYASFGPAAPVAMLGIKYGGKALLTKAGVPAGDANRAVETVGMFGGCYNLVLAVGAAAPPALALGAFCGLVYSDRTGHRSRSTTTRFLELRDGEWVLVD